MRGPWPRWSAAALAAALTLAVLPARADPAATSPGCWAPGQAPGLFAWSASPGIACRDAAHTGPALPAPAPVGPDGGPSAPGATPATAAPGVAPTFSGNAYVGIAATF